jgi:hypothetical protein
MWITASRAIAALCVGYPGPHADRAEAQGHLDEDQLGVVPGYLQLLRPGQLGGVAGGQPPVTSSPSYSDNGTPRACMYELRFYDPPNGFTVTLWLRGDGRPRVRVSDDHRGPGGAAWVRPAACQAGPVAQPQLRLVVIGRTLRP